MVFRRFGNLRRVDKRVARRLYNEGKDVLFIPCNLRPDNMWGLGIMENIENCGNVGWTFDELVDNYIWYNCNEETGKYVSFYVEG